MQLKAVEYENLKELGVIKAKLRIVFKIFRKRFEEKDWMSFANVRMLLAIALIGAVFRTSIFLVKFCERAISTNVKSLQLFECS